MKGCELNNNDINLTKFIIVLLCLIFTTHTIENLTGFKREYIFFVVLAFYFLIFYLISKKKAR